MPCRTRHCGCATAVLTVGEPSLFDQPSTSREALESIDAARLRRLVYREYVMVGPQGLTPDEVAARLHRSVLTIRPRCTELRQQGMLVRTGERRKNRSGLKANVLRAI